MNLEKLDNFISKIPDYPEPGILFYDISTLIHDDIAFNESVNLLMNKIIDIKFDKIGVIDARGFIFGSALANKLKKGLVMIRKSGKIPGNKKLDVDYELEYGKDTLEINPDLCNGKDMIIVDDLLATGGTANASINLIEKAGGKVIFFLTLIELTFLNGKSKIKCPLESIIKYSK